MKDWFEKVVNLFKLKNSYIEDSNKIEETNSDLTQGIYDIVYSINLDSVITDTNYKLILLNTRYRHFEEFQRNLQKSTSSSVLCISLGNYFRDCTNLNNRFIFLAKFLQSNEIATSSKQEIEEIIRAFSYIKEKIGSTQS